MTTERMAEIKSGIYQWITPLLIAIIGYMLKGEYAAIKASLQSLHQENKEKTEIIIEVREKVKDLERRLQRIEDSKQAVLYKHEETFYLS